MKDSTGLILLLAGVGVAWYALTQTGVQSFGVNSPQAQSTAATQTDVLAGVTPSSPSSILASVGSPPTPVAPPGVTGFGMYNMMDWV